MKRYSAIVTITVLDVPAESPDALELVIQERLTLLDIAGGRGGRDGYISEEYVDHIQEMES